MAHDKVYGHNLYTKNQYLLQGPFWDGFRRSCKWTAPAYAIFFCIAAIGSNTVWQTLWCLLMVVISTVVIYLAWKAAECT